MKKFMIGQYGKYDFNKFNRDYRENFYGIEACLLQSEEDIDHLTAEAKKKGYNIGIHFPLRAGVHEHRDPQFLALDYNLRKEVFKSVENELDYIREKGIKPKYILFHYPKPVLLNENADWRNWRFTDSSEYVYKSEYSYNEFVRNSKLFLNGLSKKVLNIALFLFWSLMLYVGILLKLIFLRDCWTGLKK